MNTLRDELHRLYSDASKHSVYQNIPDFVSEELGYTEPIDEAWRGDRPRLAYLLAKRPPVQGEKWVDFGANTGFFTLSLAKQYQKTTFIAVEANPNHAHFIASVAHYFELDNVEIIPRAVGLNDLDCLPRCDFLLHLNVLHHAGHDFDTDLVLDRSQFPKYALGYLAMVRRYAAGMLFQMGSNWGGQKSQPLVDVLDNVGKLQTFSDWLHSAGWRIRSASCARRGGDGRIGYQDLKKSALLALTSGDMPSTLSLREALIAFDLNHFPGEFYRRPLFLCDSIQAV